jgi:hypothetical protein
MEFGSQDQTAKRVGDFAESLPHFYCANTSARSTDASHFQAALLGGAAFAHACSKALTECTIMACRVGGVTRETQDLLGPQIHVACLAKTVPANEQYRSLVGGLVGFSGRVARAWPRRF